MATYTSLAPGTYTFRVKAANSSGFWTKNEASIQVIVRPPWWATWWAYGCMRCWPEGPFGAISGFIPIGSANDRNWYLIGGRLSNSKPWMS
ncbi:triple tyrosine motif-containing protein [Spirosoma jeollabukense]